MARPADGLRGDHQRSPPAVLRRQLSFVGSWRRLGWQANLHAVLGQP
ncbi:MAG TPA: hypothetical protein VGH27_18565 [Streptosporangiaceae bacterium]